MGTTSCDKESPTLAPLFRLDQRTIHDPNRSREPHILEIPTKPEQMHCTMAHRSTGIRLRNQTHPWEHKHTCRCSIMTTRSRPGRKQQPKNHHDPTVTCSQHHNHRRTD